MKVSEVMTRRVISVSPKATILDAIRLMLKNRISGLPVIDDDGALVGMVTEGDFLRRAETGTAAKRSRWLDAFVGPSEPAQAYVRSHGVNVEDVMTHTPVTVASDNTLDKAVEKMERHKIKRLPVVRRGRVVGIISRANLMRGLVSMHRGARASMRDDATIRERILSAAEEESWAAGASVDVIVRHGIVDVWGTVSEPAQRRAFKALVEGTPGVKKVEDHLVWQGDVVSVT
jgi:CBS domain-containing protein